MDATPAALELPPIRAWLSITQRNIVYAQPEIFDDVFYVIAALYNDVAILENTKRGICRLEIKDTLDYRERNFARSWLAPFNEGKETSVIRNIAEFFEDAEKIAAIKAQERTCTAIVPYTRPLAIVPAGFWK